MNIHLKSAVQHLDAHIVEVTDLRNRLAGNLGEPVGDAVPISLLKQPPAVPMDAEHAGAAVPAGRRRSQADGPRKQSSKSRVPSSRGDAGGFSAMSEVMLKAGAKLNEPFGMADLRAESGCETKEASNAITRWKLNGMIKQVEKGRYRRLAAFGKAMGAGGRAGEVSRETHETTRETRVLHQESEVARPTEKPAGGTPGGAQPALPGPKPPEGGTTNEKLTPYSARGIAVGRSLKAVFSMTDLAALLPQGLPSAYYFVAQWRAKNWIRKEDHDVYRKEANFGE